MSKYKAPPTCDYLGCKENAQLSMRFVTSTGTFALCEIKHLHFCKNHFDVMKPEIECDGYTMTYMAEDGYQIRHAQVFSPVFETLSETADAWNSLVDNGVITKNFDTVAKMG